MKIVSASLLIFFVAMGAAAQARRQNKDVLTLVETERVFSRTSEEKGIRESFAEFIAEDGILFRPRAVLGKKWMQEHPLPVSSTRPLLVWQPILAWVSRAGDLGYTTGLWQYKNNIKDKKPAAFGNFMTVWRKQPDGRWRFALDLGISNPEPKSQPSLSFSGPAGTGFRRIETEVARADLLQVERAFSAASAKRGAVEAFLAYAASDVRLFRNDKYPLVGRKSAVMGLTPLSTEWTWTPEFADVSTSGDLGYSYGTYELRDKTSRTISETGNFAHVWKKVGRSWKLVIDVADPVPPEKKN